MCNSNRKPHVHADVIKAWADGAEVQWRTLGLYRCSENKGWQDTDDPEWSTLLEYRVKPEPPDLEKYGVEVGDVWNTGNVSLVLSVKVSSTFTGGSEVKLMTDGSKDHRAGLSKSVFRSLLFRRGVVNKL